MEALWIALGVALGVLAIADLFFTILHYEGSGLLSRRLYRAVWTVAVLTVRPLAPRTRLRLLGLAAPSMLVFSLALWLAGTVAGFAFVHYAGMTDERFDFPAGTGPSPLAALYLSGVSLSTLGYGDITPVAPAYQLLGFLEALIGFGILTLSLSYFLSVYQALAQKRTFGTEVQHVVTGRPDAREAMAQRILSGHPGLIGDRLASLQRELVAQHEALRRYPVIYYFTSSEPESSLPYSWGMIGRLLGALRWALPAGHPARHEPEIHTLDASFGRAVGALEDEFGLGRAGAVPAPVAFDSFRDALQSSSPAGDPLLVRFVALERRFRVFGEDGERPDPEEVYGRYREWLPFEHRVDHFIRSSASDLGLDSEELIAKTMAAE